LHIFVIAKLSLYLQAYRPTAPVGAELHAASSTALHQQNRPSCLQLANYLHKNHKCLANSNRRCHCSVLCLRPKSSLWSCPHFIFRRDVIRQRCRNSVV